MGTDSNDPLYPGFDEAAVVGLGAVGTPLVLDLLSLGVRRFVLFDPKVHKPENVATQCAPGEVGQLKVKVAARKLRRAGAERVIAWPYYVELVEPGWVGRCSIVVACGDRLSAVRAAHDLARSLRRPFFRLNIEPLHSLTTLSCYDYRPETIEVCALCGWGPREYAAQESVTSCAPSRERPTGSPRALSSFAAGWGAMTIVRTMSVSSSPSWGQSFSFSADGPQFVRSILPSHPECLGHHSDLGDVVRLHETPRELSIHELCRLAGYDDDGTVVTGSGQIAARARCDGCCETARGCWWSRSGQPAGRCDCGGTLHPLPFSALSSFGKRDVSSGWDLPLSSLGVRRKAIITLNEDARCTHFIIG